jgi:hypothetical protein
LGIGDWGLGIGPNPQSPIPNPQSPIPNPHIYRNNILYKNLFHNLNKNTKKMEIKKKNLKKKY